MTKLVSLRLSCLDQQIVDRDRLPIGRVDDVEIALDDDRPRVVALLCGAQALGERLGGSTGGLLAGAAARLRRRGASAPSVPIDLVTEMKPMIRLRARFEDLPEIAALERWLAARFVRRIPGAGDAPQ